MNKRLLLGTLISIDDSGWPKAPDIRQLQDKDVQSLWVRDNSTDKEKYIKEVGVIYYCGDPLSPPRQKGFNMEECLKEAIDNYNLPKDYRPDKLVERLINRYWNENISDEGLYLLNLKQALKVSAELINIIIAKLRQKISECDNPTFDISDAVNTIQAVTKQSREFPDLFASIDKAYENLINREEAKKVRGGKDFTSSMNADEYR